MTVNLELVGVLFAILVGVIALFQGRRPILEGDQQARRPASNDEIHSWGAMMAQLADRDRKIAVLSDKLERLQESYDRLLEDNNRQKATNETLLGQLVDTQARVKSLNYDVETLLNRARAAEQTPKPK